MNLAIDLRDARVAQGLSQRDIAERMGSPFYQTVTKLEIGERLNALKVRTLLSWAHALGYEVKLVKKERT